MVVKKSEKCEQCDKKYLNLKQHISRVHEESIKKPKCVSCKKDFSSLQALKFHVQCVHEKLKTYKCNFCHKAYGKPGHLNIHMNTAHNDSRNFKCDHCNRTFKLSVYLKRHLRKWHANLKIVPKSEN